MNMMFAKLIIVGKVIGCIRIQNCIVIVVVMAIHL